MDSGCFNGRVSVFYYYRVGDLISRLVKGNVMISCGPGTQPVAASVWPGVEKGLFGGLQTMANFTFVARGGP